MSENELENISIDPKSVEAALEAIVNSEEFSGADRLTDFLKHVVGEDLAGRGGSLRAKTIAVDVYRRSAGEADAENLVRVDAGRLRRRLDVYYAGSGAADPLRIHIDRGGYAPRYSQQSPNHPIDASGEAQTPLGGASMSAASLRDMPFSIRLAVLAALVALPFSGLVLAQAYRVATREAPPQIMTQAEQDQSDMIIRREILFNEAPERLQALNLVEQGLNMFFPAPDSVRTEAALILFQRAALLDPSYAGAPAATALAAGVRAGLSPPGEHRQAALVTLEKNARAASSLDAANPLSLTAQAFRDFLAKDYTSARERLERAKRIDPTNGHVTDFYSIFALFAGDFETTLRVSNPEMLPSGAYRRGASQNARATAMLLTGRPEQAIEILVHAAAMGDPISVINHSVLAASFQADGQPLKARHTRDRMLRAWPGVDLNALLKQLFYDPAHAEIILDHVEAIG
ncbi:MAG: hypothetical protein AAGG56_06955 [Pseudomonadota bacterium]